MGSALMLAIGLMLVALVLFMIEAMIPSFGVIGITGAAAMIGSLVFAFRVHPGIGAVFLLAGPIGAVVIFFLGLKLLPKTRFGRSFILSGPVNERDQTVETGLEGLEGREGVAKTMLRPSGVALIDNERVNVLTEGGIINKNSRIKVIKVMGNRVFVEKL